MSDEEMDDLIDYASQVASVGATLTVVEFLIFFFSGRAIKSMWLLVSTLQFLVYIGMWQI